MAGGLHDDLVVPGAFDGDMASAAAANADGDAVTARERWVGAGGGLVACLTAFLTARIACAVPGEVTNLEAVVAHIDVGGGALATSCDGEVDRLVPAWLGDRARGKKDVNGDLLEARGDPRQPVCL